MQQNLKLKLGTPKAIERYPGTTDSLKSSSWVCSLVESCEFLAFAGSSSTPLPFYSHIQQAILPLPLALPKSNLQQPDLSSRPNGQLGRTQRRHQIREPSDQHHILPPSPKRRLPLAATETYQLSLRRTHHFWILPPDGRHGIRGGPTTVDLQQRTLLRCAARMPGFEQRTPPEPYLHVFAGADILGRRNGGDVLPYHRHRTCVQSGPEEYALHREFFLHRHGRNWRPSRHGFHSAGKGPTSRYSVCHLSRNPLHRDSPFLRVF